MDADKNLPLWFVCFWVGHQSVYLHVRNETKLGAVTYAKDQIVQVLTRTEIECLRVNNVFEVTA
jgi:hypothetical protein